MAFTAIAAGDVDAKSPVTDSLMTLIKTNQDHLKSVITAGASAVEGVSTTTVTTSGNGTIGGGLTVTGQLSTGSFFVSDNILNFWDWGY